jgi:hypothetical protein
MFSLLLSLRVTDPLGMIQIVPILEDSDVLSFLKSNSPSVLFFPPNRSHFSFASLAVYRYRKQFKFSFATESAGFSLNLSNFPIAAVFNGSTKIFSTYSSDSAIEFAQQCHHHLLYALPKPKILQAEELRRLLNTEETFVFGVDLPDPFTAFRNDVLFFAVKSEVFREIGFNLTAGYYAYRGIDRNLALIPDTKLRKYREYLKTPIVRMAAVNFTERPFAGGYVMDIENETNSEEQIRILRQLAPKFPRFAFSPIVGEKGKELAEIGNFSMTKAGFVIWKDGWNTKPWILNGVVVWNETVLRNWIEEVQEQFFPGKDGAETKGEI